MFYSVINIKIVQLHCEKYCQLCNFALPKKVSGEMNSVCVCLFPFDRCDPHCGPSGQRSREHDRDQWPHLLLSELPQAGEGAWLEQRGEYRTCPHTLTHPQGGGGESDAGERNKKKVEEQKDRHFLECFFFHFRRFWKRLNLLHLNKSHREHSKMVMFHVCQTKAFYVTYFHSWLKASVWFYLFICSSE